VKAIVQRAYGPPLEVLKLEDVPEPSIGDDEVLLRVQAGGVNALDWHLVTGVPYLVRVAGNGLRRPGATGVGRDVAGVVAAVGSAVTRFAPGDEVFGWCVGAFAELVATSETTLVPKPVNTSFAEAAAVPVAATTALLALRERGAVQPGQHVLITGASGGVGLFAVQLAKAFGAEVTAVCSTRNLDLVRDAGADHVVDYTTGPVHGRGGPYDLILDIAGRPSLAGWRRSLTPRGRLVLLGGEGGTWLGPLPRMTRAAALFAGSRQAVRFLDAKLRQARLEELAGFLERSELAPVIDRTFALDDAPAAVRYLEIGHTQGKVIVEP
jgi:NADPH:quinone reductase-like Zn-dependent oxidoreductase